MGRGYNPPPPSGKKSKPWCIGGEKAGKIVSRHFARCVECDRRFPRQASGIQNAGCGHSTGAVPPHKA